jgi:hypothetical protein
MDHFDIIFKLIKPKIEVYNIELDEKNESTLNLKND